MPTLLLNLQSAAS